MSLTKASYSMITGAPANVLDYGADATGTNDSASAFNAALAVSKYVFIPSGTYKILSTITIPPYAQIFGAGINNTTVTIAADYQAFVLQYYSQLRQLTVTKSGTHTHNLIEVGSSSLDGGRAVISDVYVSGAGADGIQLIQGNLGTLENIVSVSNGLNGIRFLHGNNNLNAWTIQGYNDLRSNGNDGLNIEGGTSLGDNYCSVSNFITGVTAQQNSNYGVFIGTRSNLVSCYGELNTTADVQLGTYARGNEVKTVQGAIVDSSGNPSFNIVYNYNSSGGYQRIFQNQTLFSGVANTGLAIYNNDGASGVLALTKTGTNSFAFTGQNSSGNFTFSFKNAAAPTAYITTTFGGNTQPDTDNAFNLGAASYRWSTVYAATGTINTSDANQKQQFSALTDAEQATAKAIKGLFKTFKFNDAVDKKGANARTHIGVSAQEVQQAFTSNGLDATKYGLFCSDTWWTDGNGKVYESQKDSSGNSIEGLTEHTQLGVRYEELLAFVISAI
jgi:hypothetical protein